MFYIKSLDEQGFPLELATERPAWFALYYNKTFLGHFVSVQDCKEMADWLKSLPEALVGL